MLDDMRRALPEGIEWPYEFLSSAAMSELWKVLRTRIEVPVAAKDAVEASHATTQVVDHFLTVAISTSVDTTFEGAQ